MKMTDTAMNPKLLELKGVSKVYPNGVVANKNIDFSVQEGEIHAIVGENGAGKSTLMKLLFGMEQPTAGTLYFKGQAVTIGSSAVAIDMGIGMVHQHFMLVPSFTVTENLLLGIEPKKGLFIDREASRKQVAELSERYQLKVDPDRTVASLTVGMKQKVEILKALLRGAKILILDEPTAVLTPQETRELFVQLGQLRREGHTIIFISHKLREVKAISDRVTILRHGETQGVFDTEAIDEAELSRRMVGRAVHLSYNKAAAKPAEARLKAERLSLGGREGKPRVQDVSFEVRAGEILGIAGVEGNGQTDLVRMLTGGVQPDAGTVYLEGLSIKGVDILTLRKRGLSYIPEDRMSVGIAGDAGIDENILANRILDSETARMRPKVLQGMARQLVETYAVSCANTHQPIRSLSGGNIQKVVVARECSVAPRVLVAEQPTRGVDVGSIQFIHEALLSMRNDGTAIVLISADLNEILELSDRILVLFEGRVSAAFEAGESVTEEALGQAMLGLTLSEDADMKEEQA